MLKPAESVKASLAAFEHQPDEQRSGIKEFTSTSGKTFLCVPVECSYLFSSYIFDMR